MWRVNKSQFWRITLFLPVAIPVALAVFSVVAMLWLISNKFNGWFVWPTALAAAGYATWLLYKRYPHDKKPSREAKIATSLVLAGVFVWTGINMHYTSQHIHTNRDPATYAVASIWLAKHDNLQIPIEDPFGSDTQLVQQTSAGFGRGFGDTIYAQGAHLLPALLGLVGKVTSPSILLHVNPLFAGTALLAVYAFGRFLMKERWALVATTAMAACLPLIYFSRDTYTEPLALTFAFGAMTMITLAFRQKDRLLWIFAGLLAGAGQLARIDSVLSIIGMVFAILALLAVAEKKDRRLFLRNVIWFSLALVFVMTVGYLDVYFLSHGYYENQLSNMLLQGAVLVALIVAGVIAVTVAWKTNLLKALDKKTVSWRAKAAAYGVGAICLILASRPLWMVGHRQSSIGLTEGLQAAAVLPIDGFRDYSEITINWISWYVGLPLTVLALFGIMIIAFRAMKTRKDIVWMLALAVVFSAALAYCVRPSITPDQIWASRRFLPVVMPGVALFGALTLAWLEQRGKMPWKLNTTVVVSVVGTLAVVAPLITALPFARTRTYVPMLAQTQSVCDQVPKNAAVLWIGMARLNQVQPTRAVCGIASAGYLGDLSEKMVLSKAAKEAISKGHRPIVGVYGDQFGIVPKEYADKFKETKAIEYEIYNHHLVKPPRDIVVEDRSLLVAEIAEDGTIKKLEP